MKCHTCRKGWVDIDVAGEVEHDICPDCNGTGRTPAEAASRITELESLVRELRAWIKATIHLCGHSRELVAMQKTIAESEDI
jgi:hypothetical protein